MFVKTLILCAALAEARFGQEQVPIAAINSLTAGAPGVAQTLAGGSVQFLLAAANPCGKLSQADAIVAQLGTSDDVIAAARGLVAAEQNFNPFVTNVPTICSDPTLPTTEALRGILPLVDPAVLGSDAENQNANTSKVTPFTDATGLSVADLMIAHGFSNFTTKDAAGNVGTAAASSNSTAASAAAPVASTDCVEASIPSSTTSSSCGGTVTTFSTVTVAASTAVVSSVTAVTSASAIASTSATASAAAATGSVQQSTISGLDFGLCVPTIKFEAGLDGRAATEFTFQAIDPLVNKGQEEALNPNIITNRICDQLTNVCEANQAAKDACATAKAAILSAGTRDQSTADSWNTMLGFAGTNTNPDNAPPAAGETIVGHT